MPSKNITAEQVLEIIAKGLNATQEQGNPIQKDYVNPTAVALLTGAGYDVKKQDGSPLSLTPIQKIDILQEFNRNDEYSGQEAKERLALIVDQSEFMNRFKVIYGDQLTIPIDMRASLPEQLTSSVRAGSQTSINRRELGAVFGIELYLLHCELQKDIPIQLIRNNLYNPNFENELDQMLNTSLANDFLRLATNGYADTFDAIGEDFYTLATGHEKILQEANGSWTNSNGTSLVLGRWGHKVTPNKVDIGEVTGITSATEKPTAPEVQAIFDGLIDNLPHEYRNYADTLIVSPEEYDLYVKSRAMPVATKSAGFGNTTGDVGINNTYRENIQNTWIAPPYRNREVIMNPFKKYIGQSYSGSEVIPNIILANMNEFYMGLQKRVDADRRYNARSDDGGPAIEITKHFWLDFQIRNREACSIAYYGATVETPVLADSDDIKADNFFSDGKAFTEADSVYPYCDTKGVRIFVGTSDTNAAAAEALIADLSTAVGNLGTGDGTTQEVDPGDEVSIAEIGGAKTYFSFGAFKDGVLTKSSLVTVSVD